MRETEGGAKFDEMPNRVRNIVLLLLRESFPPVPEFIGELDPPGHTHSMPYTEYFLEPDREGNEEIGFFEGRSEFGDAE